MERARLTEGSLLVLRTGRGVFHAEGVRAEDVAPDPDGALRSVLFWVNLARKDKAAEPTARVMEPDEMPVRQAGDAAVRVLVGEGSPAELGTPAIVLDVLLEAGGGVSHAVPAEFHGFAYLLEGSASFGANRGGSVPGSWC